MLVNLKQIVNRWSSASSVVSSSQALWLIVEALHDGGAFMISRYSSCRYLTGINNIKTLMKKRLIEA